MRHSCSKTNKRPSRVFIFKSSSCHFNKESNIFPRSSSYNFFRAYHHLGFSYIINQGIDTASINIVFEASRRFHALPLKEKPKISLDHKHRGYTAINTALNMNSKFAEVKTKSVREVHYYDGRPDRIFVIR